MEILVIFFFVLRSNKMERQFSLTIGWPLSIVSPWKAQSFPAAKT